MINTHIINLFFVLFDLFYFRQVFYSSFLRTEKYKKKFVEKYCVSTIIILLDDRLIFILGIKNDIFRVRVKC